MIRGCLPAIIEQFDTAQHCQRDTTPVIRRSGRTQTALAFPAILITKHPQFALAVPTEPMRTEQPRPLVIDGRNRSALLNRPVQIRVNRPGTARSTCASTRHSFRLR